MFPVTITLHDQTELQAVMSVLSGIPQPVAAPLAQAAKQDDTAKKPKSQASTSAKTPETSAPTPPTAEGAAAGAPEAKGDNSAQEQASADEQPWSANPDYKTAPQYVAVGNVVIAMVKSKGREAAAALLEKVAGVKLLPEAKPSQSQAIIDAFSVEA